MLVPLHWTQEESEVRETERRQGWKDEHKMAKDISREGIDWQEASSQGHCIWRARFRRARHRVGARDTSRSTPCSV